MESCPEGYIDAILLSVIAERESYGYEIARVVDERTGGALQLKEGTLYPALRRLEAAGWLESGWGREADGPRRRYYRITPHGRKELARMRDRWRENARVIGRFLGEVQGG
ncbi:PadR family transcriptional regulator [Alicyclobacillus macrosporangiidus]|uniref:PadR family transcriptional regulator n=1 Tax=Alicyclobacillus macrosporangiidus TaxID=392015 RepID=UPI0026EFE9B4|nr:helix-turn-helix transcriptional regulator [Alicyclobacillus macrosporangiidus]